MMEHIGNAMKKLSSNQKFMERQREIQNRLLKDERIQGFLEENKEIITDEMIEKAMPKFYEFTKQCQNCSDCIDLQSCVNLMQGYVPHLFLSGLTIDLKYERCKTKKIADEQARLQKLVNSVHIPKDILKASFGQVDLQDEGRLQSILESKNFASNYDGKTYRKGLYLYGKFGVGKTYLFGAIANALAQKEIASMIMFYPEFIRELKGSFADDSINQKLEAVKKVQVLMIDDIGSESMSSWSRDEVLGPILQYRMLENLPTFFTSNFSLKELEDHFTYSQRGEEEKVKAARIMERIRYLSEPILVQGTNRRN